VHRSALGAGALSDEWARDRLPAHTERSDFLFLVREEWLDQPHYEIVELHVRPAWQRRGIGSALLAQLLTRQPHDRALLSTQAGARKARTFYAKNGWQELASIDFGRGYPPYLALGKLVRRPRAG
jgi:GNAT superfamily N-acetyltransferase